MDLLIIAIAVLIIINIHVSFRLLKCDSLEVFQKVAQTIVIWLIPIIGAIIIYSFVSSYDKPNPPRNRNDGQGNDSMPGGVQ